jgi:hypothetical protein
MTQYSYSFLDVQATIAGPGGSFSMGNGAGIAEEGITVEFNEDKDTQTIGADGTPMHSLHAGKGGKITVRVLKTSPLNAQLSQLYAFQTSSSANHGQNVVTVDDPARGDSISARAVAFMKFPVVTYAKDGAMNEWSFNVGILDILLGSGAPAIS